MSTATTEAPEQEREGMPETWPVETVDGQPVFSSQVRREMRAGGIVRALETLADVQDAALEHLEKAYDGLEHEGVKHTVGFALDRIYHVRTDLRRAAGLYWLERNGTVEVREWPGPIHKWWEEEDEDGDGEEEDE